MAYKDLEKKKKWQQEYQRKPETNIKRRLSRLQQLEIIAGRPRPPTCEVCGNGNELIVFDHNHSTGRFRGWICHRCNKALGTLQDNREILIKLAKYLEKDDSSIPLLETPIKVNDLIVRYRALSKCQNN